MRACDIFQSEEERSEVKSWLDLFEGALTQVLDEDGNVLFQSKISFDF